MYFKFSGFENCIHCDLSFTNVLINNQRMLFCPHAMTLQCVINHALIVCMLPVKAKQRKFIIKCHNCLHFRQECQYLKLPITNPSNPILIKVFQLIKIPVHGRVQGDQASLHKGHTASCIGTKTLNQNVQYGYNSYHSDLTVHTVSPIVQMR